VYWQTNSDSHVWVLWRLPQRFSSHSRPTRRRPDEMPRNSPGGQRLPLLCGSVTAQRRQRTEARQAQCSTKTTAHCSRAHRRQPNTRKLEPTLRLITQTSYLARAAPSTPSPPSQQQPHPAIFASLQAPNPLPPPHASTTIPFLLASKEKGVPVLPSAHHRRTAPSPPRARLQTPPSKRENARINSRAERRAVLKRHISAPPQDRSKKDRQPSSYIKTRLYFAAR
jgi:hypothetical protein